MTFTPFRLPLHGARTRFSFPFLLLALALVGLTSCQKDWWQFVKDHKGDIPVYPVTNDMFLTWNKAGMDVVTMAGKGPNGPLPPMPESRIYAMLNIAMYDALMNIDARCKPYALLAALNLTANADAAVAQAGHDMIVGIFPPFTAFADSLLNVSLSGISEGKNKSDGISVGKAAAAAMIASRANDGAAIAQIPYTGGTLPGQYRATPPFDGPPFNGFVAVPGWGNIKPFAMTSGSQFRAPGPYDIKSKEYATDFNEIKSFGPGTKSKRTADQSQIGIFWLENIPHFMNRIARQLIIEKKLDAWQTARCLALMAMAEADANIGCLESKYYFNTWRPQTAVPLGDHDGNTGTTARADWVAFGAPTPPVPDYPSNHSANGGAGAEVLIKFFGRDNISMDLTSVSLPNVTRHYDSFSKQADDIALSRIYVGYHFRHAVLHGKAQGKQIGDYVMANALQPN